MEQLNLIHLGLGHVGRAVMQMIFKNAKQIKEKHGVELKYCGFFRSSNGYYYPFGFPFSLSTKYENEGFVTTSLEAIERVPTPFVVIDTTASTETFPLLIQALERGGHVVMSN